MDNPFSAFEFYFQEAAKAQTKQPEAMVLSTSTKDGQVSSRLVLFRGIIRKGFSFYTNYNSRKGHDLEENFQAALLFYWELTGRQVRIEGSVAKLTKEESDDYWNSRARGHQISALISDQSHKIESLDVLRKKRDALEEAYRGKPIPRPQHWGGYHLLPTTFEFWKLGEDRFHERVLFERAKQDSWKITYLSP